MVNSFELTSDERSVLAVLSKLGEELPGTFYILGGWAFDIWAGKKTRAHSDFDLICPPQMWDRVGERLVEMGGDFKRQGVTKRIVVSNIMLSVFKDPDDELRPMSDRCCTVEFEGMAIPVMDAVMLLDTKENLYHRFGIDYYLHKDIHDIRLMRGLLEQGI
ncbi:hypothetical protein I9018_31285 [Pseudomonas sp. MPFS]|uniref:nucleotidyltransferase domain-containing protein n=1 Tax=Pseudomonas sp. MPFS TaxID=2795724 RepID=UPI001F1438F7|nr:hypothetical protein [Pseudomonas sp. MPFS]UMZ11900.1 hypothetical protein I9018_31285 [Pseudomonas sp. MPFS]